MNLDKNTEDRLIETIPVRLERETIRIQNYDINHVSAGEGEPVLLIHGGNVGWGQWYPNIAQLAEHHRVYAIDLPGAGRSTRLDFSRLDLKRDFVDVVDEFIGLKDLEGCSIIGSSIGGWIGLEIVLRHPERTGNLVLVDSLGFTKQMRLADRLLGIHPLARLLSLTVLRPNRSNKNIEKFLRDVFHDKDFPLRQEFIEYFYETMNTSHNLLLISRLSSPLGMRSDFLMEEKLPTIGREVMAIWGEKDALLPPEQSHENIKLIRDVRFEVLPDAGHIPNIESSDRFNHLVGEFLG